MPDYKILMIQTNDFFTPKYERGQKKSNKKFNFLPQEQGEYSQKEIQLKDIIDPEDKRFENTVLYEILRLQLKIKRLKRAEKIVNKFNSRERKTNIMLRIDCNNGRFNLRFGHKDKMTLNQMIV